MILRYQNIKMIYYDAENSYSKILVSAKRKKKGRKLIIYLKFKLQQL